ncbi:heme ABC exporter ATP-binding protein CcmA [Alphaproteobacteria bacterium KMM 3653]|uniref:Heme ABC exporter ATP-binding protein CcmA n=1 Tax=Harenicola maris TaxID=2841044 RepID=A0AAP2CT57_9RHOB|nr:heme ABC exporter ATP-binding protein CcmA [Harenicola maris]
MSWQADTLACQRGGRVLLAGLSLRLAKGQVLILRGPNGVGKTTLLRTLAGLQPAAGGTLNWPADDMAYASHADGIKATLSARENLAFWAGIYGAGDPENALETFGLTPLAGRAAGTLSAGQRRRLGLARLVLSHRPVWLCDEPTVSLDAEHTEVFANAVRAHCAKGGAAVLATHIDLGLTGETLDLTPFAAAAAQATQTETPGFDEAFL